MAFNNLQDYHGFIVSHVARHGLVSELHKIQLIIRGNRYKGAVRGELTFSDSAKLSFIESIELDAGEIRRLKYSFHYTYGQHQFFRYDKDPVAANPPVHAECHLHVNDENGPRYITHETNFSEVFDFIIAHFYEHTNSRKPRQPE
jgi:hypothetical protein